LRSDDIGDWRDVLQELPKRIHEWMPRLASEGVVGADAIFACLGPALEVYSRYSRVETAAGQVIPLGDGKDEHGQPVRGYLSYVWEAVSKEALNMIFKDADASGFEEDARLTAMWLWTLSAGAGAANGSPGDSDSPEDLSENEESPVSGASAGGYSLEYDAARKIAQGLGAHLEKLNSLVEVKGSTARLLSVAQRARFLFARDDETFNPPARQKGPTRQLSMFDVAEMAELAEQAGSYSDKPGFMVGKTTLDHVHQAMLLFGAGRGEALKRFLVESGLGREEKFRRLAQAFSALYPTGSEEKRWVDGVQARLKGLGF
jgi:hypothetical protein